MLLLPFLLSALWLLYAGTPLTNTLDLAASGRIDFSEAWFYRFRGAAVSSGFILPLFFFVLKITGVQIFAVALLLLQVLALRRLNLVWHLVFGATAMAAAFWGETLLLWSTAAVLWVKTIASLRKAPGKWQAAPFAVAAFTCTAISLAVANPAYFVHRQGVLGGKSFFDQWRLHKRPEKIHIEDDCVAAINPEDIRGVNPVESLDMASLRKFSRIVPTDLKVVEENYRLLSLKDEHGKFLFSDRARAFAAAEMAYAAKILPQLTAAPRLCLIANFDTMPAAERAPFSRARKIFNARTQAGLDTVVIQLPGR